MKPTFRQSRELQILLALFIGLPQRSEPLVSWQEIEKATGAPRDKLRAQIATAITRARRDHNLVIESDRKLGYRLRPAIEMGQSGERQIRRVRRAARTGLEKMRTVDPFTLPSDQRSHQIVIRQVFEIQMQTTRPRARNNLVNQLKRQDNIGLTEQERLTIIRERIIRK